MIFLHGLDVLVRRKTEIPNARTLTDLIIGETRRHKGTLTEVINAHVPPEVRALLEALLEKADPSALLTPQFQRFQLTLLKPISQSAKPLEDRLHAGRLADTTPALRGVGSRHYLAGPDA